MIVRTGLLVVVVLVSAAASAAAQPLPPPDPIDSMPIRFGPLGLSPTLTIADVGVDDNVFNSESQPQRDFTATIVPRLIARLRARRLLLTYRTSSDFVYYRELESERSINNSSDLRLDVALGRLQPFVMGGLEDTRARLNAEVDIRAHRRGKSASAGTRVLVASRTALSIAARHIETEFDPNVFFEGAELAKNLNSRQQSIEGGIHLLLTPLTTLEIDGSVQQDRFPGNPARDADLLRIAPLLRFAPEALLKGTAAVGYRRFQPLSNAVPDYSGLYVATTLTYTLLGRTKFDWQLSRDVQYSFEDIDPYYLNTGTRVTVTQQLVSRFDVQGTAGRQRLEYRTTGIDDTTRVDHADVVGGGIGIRARENVRFGINAEYARRLSDRVARQYARRRIFVSLNYGS
jgi:hypothetical protein